MYNRAVRVHKYIYEALLQVIWKQFIAWETKNYPNKLMHLRAIRSEAEEMAETFSVSQYHNVWNSESLLQVHQLWSQYLEHLSHENSKLSAFWMSYIHLVGDVLLGLIRASREGYLLPHLYAVHHMFPWCFAYDKFNFARYLLVYYAQMANLLVEHPDVPRNFMEGHFSMQLAGESPFGRILGDQTMEVAVNKDKKTTGIVTIFSLKTRAINRFYPTAECRCAFLDQLRSLVQAKRPQFHHNEMQSPRMPKDENQVLAVEALVESWNNPSVRNQDLNSIATSKEAPADIHMTYFTPVRFENKNYSNSRRKSFKAPIPRRSLTIL